MRWKRRGRCQTQARGAPCASHLRKDENEEGEACRRGVQAHERPVRSREETRGMSMRRCAVREQGQEVEARLSDMSCRRKGFYGYLVNGFHVGTR